MLKRCDPQRRQVKAGTRSAPWYMGWFLIMGSAPLPEGKELDERRALAWIRC